MGKAPLIPRRGERLPAHAAVLTAEPLSMEPRDAQAHYAVTFAGAGCSYPRSQVRRGSVSL